MPADNTGSIIAAARHRHELTRAKAIRALRELDHAGTPVTFEMLARAAGVSRSWLYGQPDIREQIQRLRQAAGSALTPPIPASQRSTDASLRVRLQAALDRNRQLANENKSLRRQLAHALGQQRTSGPRTQPSPDRPARPDITVPQRSDSARS